MRPRIDIAKSLLVFLFSALPAIVSADGINKLFSLSLEELVNLEINTGSLFTSTSKDAASAITIINRDKIEMSGAKNLATLLEQHVPGMIVMNHSEGNKIGLRGHIAAENYKLLLLVNGKNITNFVYEGVITEIDQWELGDIQRVEVVSGPGSVTYGSGAIGGVINIITKTGKDDLPPFSIGVTRNHTYDSTGVNLQFARDVNGWDVYGFISARDTDGLRDPNYFKLNPSEPTDNRYVGKGSLAQASPQDFLADTQGRPQIKAHFNLNHGDNFNAWMRYTQSGQVRFFAEKGYTLDAFGNNDEEENRYNSQTRHFILSTESTFDLGDDSSLITSLTYDTQEFIRYRYLNGDYDYDNIKDYAFSQDRLKASFLYDFKVNEDIDVIAGYEFAGIEVGAPWGKNKDHLWIREGSHIISSFATSVYTQDLSLPGRPNPTDFVEVGKGMKFYTRTHLLESKYTLDDKNTFLYAHRVDFPNVSDRMFSPRMSWVTELDEDNTLVSTIQRAQRMMPLRAEYLNSIRDGETRHETVDSIEVSYTNSSVEDTSMNLRAYYNENSAVGFTGSELQHLADYDLFGLEFTATYKRDNLELTFNHTFMEALDVEMNDELKDGLSRNNISFADYYYNTQSGIPILLEGYGDGLNNWPQNISKFIVTHSFLDQRLKAHLTAQVYWDYDGSLDEMRMYQQAYDSFDRSSLSALDQIVFEQQYQQFLRERALLEERDAFEIDYNVNVSVTYLVPTASDDHEIKYKFFIENLFESSYRYNVSTGSNRTYPERLEFLDKPRMLGASLQVSF